MAAINPIIPGFSPDPSVVKVGAWYFLVNSSFHMFPGLPVYASQDLVRWKHIGNAINRPDQLSLARSDTLILPQSGSDDFLVATGGLYAPTIRYHNDTFYVVCTNVKRPDEDIKGQKDGPISDNFIVSCTDIWSNDWSDPVHFEFDGIDPSLFFEDGRAYVHGSAAPGPWTKINLFEADLSTGKKLTPERTLWQGTGGVWPEGPHIYKKEGWYYLMIAEGGTHENHSVVMARARDIWGPYESCPDNPILTAKGTKEYIQYTGHCDVFQDEHGGWWGVCLGVRKDSVGRYTMGRETFLTRGSWDGPWLSLDRVTLEPRDLKAPAAGLPTLNAVPGVELLYIRDPKLGRYKISADAATVALTASPIDISHPHSSPTFIGKRQRRLDGSSSATIRSMDALAKSKDLKAGIVCYKDEHRFVRVFYDASTSAIRFEVVNNAKKIFKEGSHQIKLGDGPLTLRISYTEQEYRLEYSTEIGPNGRFTVIQAMDTLDMTGHDFVGPVVGVYVVAKDEGLVVEFTGFSVE